VHYNTSVGGLLPGSGTVTQTLRISAGTYNFIQIFIANGTTEIANINLTNGTIGTNTLGVTATDLGSGVYDIKCTYTTTGTNRVLGVALVTSTTAARLESWTALGTETVNILFQQYEQRSSATAYTATTTQPITRYQRQLKTAAANEWPREFDPVTGECLGRSVWESRTNLLQRSEEFDNAYWTKVGATVSANQVIAPDGTLSMDKLVEDTANSGHSVQGTGVSVTSGIVYTFTIYAKAAERSFIRINGNSTGLVGAAYYNLSTGALGTVAAGTTASIVNVGNGIYRCVFTRTSTATTNVNFLVSVTNADNTSSYTGDGYSGIYIWGAQLEAGAFATPYIPTVAAQVTRVADSATMTGTNFSSWYNPSEGCFVASALTANTAATGGILSAEDGTTSNRMQLRNNSSGVMSWTSVITGTSDVGITNGSFAANVYKLGSATYKFNDYAASCDGAAVSTDTVARVPIVDRLVIGGGTSQNHINGYIKRLTYYPQALTSANLQAITR
jgi:hypothetical protein